jgi:hypothetical protein
MDLTTCYLLLCTRILVSWFLVVCRRQFFFRSEPTSFHVYFSAILELDPHMQKTLV